MLRRQQRADEFEFALGADTHQMRGTNGVGALGGAGEGGGRGKRRPPAPGSGSKETSSQQYYVMGRRLGISRLKHWVSNQRSLLKKGQLSASKTAWLRAAAFPQERQLVGWENSFQELQLFKDRFGHTNVPYQGQFYQLGTRVFNQRVMRRRGVLRANRVRRLEGVCI